MSFHFHINMFKFVPTRVKVQGAAIVHLEMPRSVSATSAKTHFSAIVIDEAQNNVWRNRTTPRWCYHRRRLTSATTWRSTGFPVVQAHEGDCPRRQDMVHGSSTDHRVETEEAPVEVPLVDVYRHPWHPWRLIV